MIKKFVKKFLSSKLFRFFVLLLLALFFSIMNTYAAVETGSLNSQLTLQKCSVYDTSIFCNPQRLVGSLQTFGNSSSTQTQLDFGTGIINDKTSYILSSNILDFSLDDYQPSSEGKYLKITADQIKVPFIKLDKTFITGTLRAPTNYTGINPFYCEYTYLDDETKKTGVCDVYFQKVSTAINLGTNDVFYIDFTGITNKITNVKLFFGSPSKDYSNILKSTSIGNSKSYLVPNTGYTYLATDANLRINDNNIIAYAPPGYYFGNSNYGFNSSQPVVSQNSFSYSSKTPVLVFNSQGPNLEEIEANAKYQDEINKAVGIQNSNVGTEPTQTETEDFWNELLNSSYISDRTNEIKVLIDSLIVTPIEKIRTYENISILNNDNSPNTNLCINPDAYPPGIWNNPEIPLWRDFSFEFPCMHAQVYNQLNYNGYKVLGKDTKSLQFWIDLVYSAILYYALVNVILDVLKYSIDPDVTDFEVMSL